jgi:hypothetical protein
MSFYHQFVPTLEGATYEHTPYILYSTDALARRERPWFGGINSSTLPIDVLDDS